MKSIKSGGRNASTTLGTKKKPKGRPKLATDTVVVSVSMPRELLEKIQEWGHRFEMPVAQAIRVLCKTSLDE